MINTFFLGTLLLVGFVGVVGWTSTVRRWRQGTAAIEPRFQAAVPLGLVDVVVMFLLWFAGQLAAATLATQWLGMNGADFSKASGDQIALLMVVAAAGSLLFTGLGWLVVKIRFPQWTMLGGFKYQKKKDLWIASITFCMVIPPILLVQWALSLLVPYEHSTLDVLKDDPSIIPLLAVWFAAVVAAPIYEEVFFRGILQGWLQRFDGSNSPPLETAIAGGWWKEEPADERANVASSSKNAKRIFNEAISSDGRATSPPTISWLPIFLSSLLFALVHLGQGFAPVPLFLFGLVLGYLFRQTGSVFPCILLHMGLNGFSMFWFTLQVFLGTP